MFNSKAQLLKHNDQIYVVQFNLKKQCLELFSVYISHTGKISYALLRSTDIAVEKRIESIQQFVVDLQQLVIKINNYRLQITEQWFCSFRVVKWSDIPSKEQNGGCEFTLAGETYLATVSEDQYLTLFCVPELAPVFQMKF